MKAVILYTSTGGGHKSAAIAISEALESFNVETKIMDSLRIAGENVTSRISKKYDRVVKVSPAFFGMLYNAGKKVGRSDRKSIIYFLNMIYASKVYEMIKEEKPDIIICTHLFSGQTITHIKNKYGLSAVTGVIITDYNCSPLWEETSLDYYFIPHEDITHEFTDKKMPKEKIFPVGIPVKTAFNSRIDKKEAKTKLEYDPEKFHILIMGGSMGAGDIYETTQKLHKEIPEAQVTVICGRNKKLYEKFESLSLNKEIRVFQFINNMPELMDSVDVLITKPGGLTSTETMVKRIPLIVINPIPGCETDNCNFFVNRNMAMYSKSPIETVKCCKLIMTNKEVSENMINAQKKYIYNESGVKIAKFLIDKAKERK